MIHDSQGHWDVKKLLPCVENVCTVNQCIMMLPNMDISFYDARLQRACYTGLNKKLGSSIAKYSMELCIDFMKNDPLRDSKDVLVLTDTFSKLSQAFTTTKHITFAKDWKLSTVRSLIKKPNLSKDLNNYRLVNNLCIISKYVETAILEQLKTYMTIKNLLPDYISAYRKTSPLRLYWSKFTMTKKKTFEEQKGVLLNRTRSVSSI